MPARGPDTQRHRDAAGAEGSAGRPQTALRFAWEGVKPRGSFAFPSPEAPAQDVVI